MQQNIIAIDSGNTDLAGAIVYWRLSGDVNGDDLNNALKAAGLSDHVLPLPTPRRALRRTMQEAAYGGLFMRAGREGDGGLYLVKQRNGDDGPEFVVQLEARLSTVGVPSFETRNYEDGNTFPEADETAREMTNRFWHHVFHVSASDISSWLIKQAAECDALSLRDSGGVYFVPRHSLDAWKQRAEALHEQTACKVYMIPSLHSDDAVDAVLQSLIDECTSFTKSLQAELEDENNELGQRALEGRADKAKALLDKLGRYEGLLGKSLDGIREQIVEQQTNAIQAALVAGGDDQ